MIEEEAKRGKKKEEWGMCAFCRTLRQDSDEEEVKRIENLMESGNANAFYQLAFYYARGIGGMPRDHQKANELYLKAGELGCAEGYYNLGCSYICGRGVEADEKKAKHYWELAAMMGSVSSRNKLGALDGNAGNRRRAYKHFILSSKAGGKQSLDLVKNGFMDGDVTKDEYESTLRAYHERQTEMKSEARDLAAKFDARQRAAEHNS